MSSVSLCNKCDNTFSFTLERKSSDVMELLRGNYVPDKSEAASYRQTVKNAEKALSDVDRTISAMNAILDQLQSARKDISRYVEQGSALLSPIRRMPNEILEATFAHLAGTVDFNCGRFHPSKPAVWSLRQVCTRWRDVATLTKSLSTHLSFNGTIRPSNLKYSSQLVELLLTYSNDAPLHVKFRARGDHNVDWRGQNTFFWWFLERTSHRIRSLAIYPWNRYNLGDIDNLPQLEDLHIRDYNGEMDRNGSLAYPICFRNVPRLCSVELNMSRIYLELKLPWKSLQMISLHTSKHGQLVFLSDHCPDLTLLEWCFPSLEKEADLAAESLCFPNVEKFVLKLSFYPDASQVVVLERLQFPVLKELEVNTREPCMPHDGIGFQSSFLTLLSHHSSTLQCLHLTNNPPLTGSKLLSALTVLPRLRRFTYTLYPYSKLISPSIYDLLISLSDDALVPELEDLQVEGDEIVIDSSVLDGLVYRRRLQGPLKRLSLTFGKIEYGENVLSRLESLRQGGLVVCINGIYSSWH